MTLPCRDLAAVVLFLENWPGEPPGGVGYAAALFRELNPRAFEVVARQRPNLSLECRKLEGPPEQFAAAAAEIAGDLLAQRHHPGMLVCQNASVQGPSRTHRFLLCSYFRAAKPTIVVLELGSSFELE